MRHKIQRQHNAPSSIVSYLLVYGRPELRYSKAAAVFQVRVHTFVIFSSWIELILSSAIPAAKQTNMLKLLYFV